MNLPIKIRNASPADLDAILILERATEFAPHWPPSTYAAILSSGGAGQATCEPMRCLFVAEDPATANLLTGFAVGLVHPGPVRDDCIAELESVAVADSARRHGVGRALCLAVLDWCRAHGAGTVVLEVRASSAAAVALYTSLGFAETGRRANYYRDPEDDALIMGRLLESDEPTSPPAPEGVPA